MTEQSHKECVNEYCNNLEWFLLVCSGTDAFTCAGVSESGNTSYA